MAVTLIETTDSRDQTVGLDDPSRTLKYTAYGSDVDLEVRNAVMTTIPAFYDSLPFQKFSLKFLGNLVCEVEVMYGRRQPGLVTINFDTSGDKKTKLMQSISSSYYPAAGQALIDFKNAIEVKKVGGTVKVEGVEVTIPSCEFTIVKDLGQGATNPIDGAFVNLLYDLTGSNNSDSINVTIAGIPLTFEPHNLLFLGAVGHQKGGTDYWEGQVTLKFSFEVNLTNATIAGITGVDKPGHDYLWVSYEEVEDTGADTIKPKAIQVNVEQVYPDDELGPLFTALLGVPVHPAGGEDGESEDGENAIV